jgi:hypothetical protein
MTAATKRAIGYLFVLTIVCTPIAAYTGLFDDWAEADARGGLSAIGIITLTWMLLSFLGLWFWMLSDFFRGREMKHRVLTGFFLVFFSWLAAVVYFVFIYVPASRATER